MRPPVPFHSPPDVLPALSPLSDKKKRLFRITYDTYHGDEPPTQVERLVIADDTFDACAAFQSHRDWSWELLDVAGKARGLATLDAIDISGLFWDDGAYAYENLLIRKIEATQIKVPIMVAVGDVIDKTFDEIGVFIADALRASAKGAPMLQPPDSTGIAQADSWRQAILKQEQSASHFSTLCRGKLS